MRNRLVFIAIPIASTVGFLACGGDDSSNATTGTGGTTSISSSSTTSSSSSMMDASSAMASSGNGGGGGGSGGMGVGGMGVGGMGVGGGGGLGPGSPIWVTTFDDKMGGDDVGSGVDVDASGNIFVVGFHTVAGQGHDILLQKYDSTGALVWTRTHNGAASLDDEGKGVAVDKATGNVVLAGTTHPNAGSTNSYVEMFDTMGNSLWTKFGDIDKAYGVAIGPGGNVVITGTIGADVGIVKYKGSDGTLLWNVAYGGPALGTDEGHGVAVDGNGNVFVTGFQTTNALDEDILLLKYDSGGVLQFNIRYVIGMNGNNTGNGVALDAAGNILVAGYNLVDNMTGYDAAYMEVDPMGNILQAFTFPGFGNSDDKGTAIHVDSAGDVLVTGQVGGVANNYDIFFGKRDPANWNPKWGVTVDGPAMSTDTATGVTTDANNNVIVVGAVTTPANGLDLWLAKYSP